MLDYLASQHDIDRGLRQIQVRHVVNDMQTKTILRLASHRTGDLHPVHPPAGVSCFIKKESRGRPEF